MSEKQRSAFRLDVNSVIQIQLESLGRTMNATLVDLSEGGCRLRTPLCLPNSTIAFMWTGPAQEPMRLWGAMVATRITDYKETEFGVRFEMTQVEKDRLVNELHEIQRRIAFKPAEMEAQLDANALGRAKRKSYRAPVRFPVTIKLKGKANELAGSAQDLSIGGLLLVSPEKLEEGSEADVQFTMPVEAVDLGGDQRDVVERTPFGERKSKTLVPVRPFEPVSAKIKVIKRAGATSGGTAYGTSFMDLAPFTGEEIARFVHAYQLTQLRRAAAAADS